MSYTHDLITDDGFDVIDRAGQNGGTGGLPRWQTNVSITYDLGRFSGTVQSRIIDGGNIDNLARPGTVTSANVYTVPTLALWNVSASYEPMWFEDGDVQLFAVVDNVSDREPPFPFIQSAFYDSIGRAYRVGARLKF